MKLTLLCNAGFALEYADSVLLVDVPNGNQPPFYTLPDDVWQQILRRRPPYDRVCGFWITHNHPDHFDRKRMEAYHKQWPQIPVFLPDLFPAAGKVHMAPFQIRYRRVDHAPIPDAPAHVISLISAGEKSVYLPADAVLDTAPHEAFLQGVRCDGAIWNPMFLSRAETRRLMEQTAPKNLVYHLPPERPDGFGLWKKVENNFALFSDQLQTVQLLEGFPATAEI